MIGLIRHDRIVHRNPDSASSAMEGWQDHINKGVKRQVRDLFEARVDLKASPFHPHCW
jgi:hypothetical protein